MSILVAVKPMSLDLLDPGLGAFVAGSHLPLAGIGVDAHAVAHLAAHQLVNGQAQGLAGDVPERDFDAGQAR